jgi:hypothetical protein
MKMFNKFANKNAGNPGVVRRWGAGTLYLFHLLGRPRHIVYDKN